MRPCKAAELGLGGPGMERQPVYPQRIKAMWAMYGRDEAHRCGECAHFRRLRYSKVCFKCDLSRLSHSAATDWRARWPACGAFEEGAREVEGAVYA